MKYLNEALIKLNIDSSEELLDKYRLYMKSVLEWNEKVNLTAITDEEEFEKKHFIDSLCCADDPRFLKSATIIDVGTGAGFPGLPLAIAFPDKEFVLMDSLNKRIKILNEIIGDLGLTNVTAVHGRAEDMARAPEYREHFDMCVSRAVSRLSVLSEYCLPFVKEGGYLAAYKGPEARDELKDASKALKILGGKLEAAVETDMNQYGIFHNILYIKKVKPTPKSYPRKAGTPTKQPL